MTPATPRTLNACGFGSVTATTTRNARTFWRMLDATPKSPPLATVLRHRGE